MRDDVSQQAVIHLLADVAGGNGGDFRAPPRRNGVVRQFDHFQVGRWRLPVNGRKVFKLFGGGICVSGGVLLLVRVGVNLDVAAGALHEWSSNDGPRKAGFLPTERRHGFACCRWTCRRRGCAAADDGYACRRGHCDGGAETVNAVVGDGKPASGIKQVSELFVNMGELQPFHRAIVGGG